MPDIRDRYFSRSVRDGFRPFIRRRIPADSRPPDRSAGEVLINAVLGKDVPGRMRWCHLHLERVLEVHIQMQERQIARSGAPQPGHD